LRLKSAISPFAICPSSARRHTSDRHRALRLLAGAPEGCPEAVMLAHGFTVELMVDLCIAEHAIATVERMVTGGRKAAMPEVLPVQFKQMLCSNGGDREAKCDHQL